MERLDLSKNHFYGLDTVTFIYFLEKHPDYYPVAKKLFRQIEDGEISAVCSALVFAELLVPAYRAGMVAPAKQVIHVLTNFPHLTIVPVTTKISIFAAELRATHGLRTPDAIHVATALQAHAGGFITNDKDLKKVENTVFKVHLFKDETAD
ncbi:MAG: PIN domain-containing protein [Desulfuromusa sp.]|nr:PIN domain-containing protein [Desulfuromusa sp.]